MRRCQICGKELPLGSAASRKYCPTCAAEHNRELTRLRYNRMNQKRSEARAEKSAVLQPIRELRDEDKAYCAICAYSGRFSADYLCDYLIMTGHKRGCRAGKGCKKRKLIPSAEPKVGERICEKCGAAYLGGKKSHYCPECRKEIMRKNAIHAIETRGKKDGG